MQHASTMLKLSRSSAISSSSHLNPAAICQVCSKTAWLHVQFRQLHASSTTTYPYAAEASTSRNKPVPPYENRGRASNSASPSRRVYPSKSTRQPIPSSSSLPHPPSNRPSSLRTRTPFRPLPHPALDPYLLAERLKKLCMDDKIDEAIEALRSSRKEAVNAAVYNILISQVLQRTKNKLAWTLWMDMKRAGIVPTPRSYTTFFSSIVPTSVTPAFLENIHTIFKQWQAFSTRETDTVHTAKSSSNPLSHEYQPTSIPTNAYLSLLAQLQPLDLEGLENIFHNLPRTGSVARTRESYSIIIRAVGSLIPNATEEQLPLLIAKLSSIWQEMLAAHYAREITLDARAISTAIHAWRSVHFKDKKVPIYSLRMQIIDEIAGLFGLPRIQEEGVEPQREEKASRLVQADGHSLMYAMALANQFGGKCGKACFAWFQAIREGNVGTVPPGLLESRHCEIVMRAEPDAAEELLIWQLRSPASRLRPDVSTYSTAMRSVNYPTAVRILAHMSGKNNALLLESEMALLDQTTTTATLPDTGVSKRASKGYHTRKLDPDAKCLRILAEKALASGEVGKMDRTLSIVQHFGLLAPSSDYTSSRVKHGVASTTATKDNEESDLLLQVCAKLWAKVRNGSDLSSARRAEMQATFGSERRGGRK